MVPKLEIPFQIKVDMGVITMNSCSTLFGSHKLGSQHQKFWWACLFEGFTVGVFEGTLTGL